MTKFERFYEFICTWFICPLVLAFVSCVTVIGIYFFANTELMWLVNLSFLLAAITALWGLVLLVVFTISKIIEWREYRRNYAEWSQHIPNNK